MEDRTGNLNTPVSVLYRHRGLLLPMIAAALIFAVLVPVPPSLMNVLLVANIALAAIILLTTIHVGSPLEFSVFPSLLLGATLVRLVLNVATTRLILTAGADGRSMAEARYAAGEVIWKFSHFVTAGSLEVGVVLFAIIAIIQFVVITKGAARISEVAARFVLDAMPGKQMAIDADLNAGLIDETTAHQRRQETAQEADFYGAMDGASKFLRGDAIAAVCITLVNILGGFYVGLVQYGWSFQQTLRLFTRLTIGDGLVTQIPAFIVAMSAALIVTRSTSKSNLGEEMISQLTRKPVSLVITACFLAALTLTSLPKAPLLLLASGCAGLAWILLRRGGGQTHDDTAQDTSRSAAAPTDGRGQSVQSLLTVEPLRIDLGFGLVSMAESTQSGSLLERIVALRRTLAEELGLLMPSVKVGDDMSLPSNGYTIKVRGLKVASGRVHPRKMLAVAGQDVTGDLTGIDAVDPASGATGKWISASQIGRAKSMNFTVTEASAVLKGHLEQVIRLHASDLLTRQQTAQLLDNLSKTAPKLVEEVTETIGTGKIQKVLQQLLAESVSIRDLETVLEAVCDSAAKTDQPELLTECVRESLGSVLTRQYCSADGKLWCVALDSALTDEIARGAGHTGRSSTGDLPAKARRISEAVAEGLARLTRHGRKPVVLCDASVRAPLRRIISTTVPQAAVLAYNEVSSAEVQSVGSVGIE